MTLKPQAAVLDGLPLDAPPFDHDRFASPKADVGWRQITNAPVVAAVVMLGDKGGDGGFAFDLKEAVFKQDAVFHICCLLSILLEV